MKYKYLVQCWIRPQSGFDLARKNRIMEMFKDIMSTVFPGEALEKAVERFEKKHEGLIIEPFFIESDKEIKKPEEEIMPEIKTRYPEAILLSFKLVQTPIESN